jgi:hypothetical protein
MKRGLIFTVLLAIAGVSAYGDQQEDDCSLRAEGIRTWEAPHYDIVGLTAIANYDPGSHRCYVQIRGMSSGSYRNVLYDGHSRQELASAVSFTKTPTDSYGVIGTSAERGLAAYEKAQAFITARMQALGTDIGNHPPAGSASAPPPFGSPGTPTGCSVPYRKYSGHIPRPQLPVRLSYGGQTIRTVALIDSGADDTVFPLSYASRLGINLANLPATETIGVGGLSLTYHAAVTVSVTFCGHEYSYPSMVAFIAGDHELLGQSGFLDHFRITLDRTKQKFGIWSVDIQPDAASQSPSGFLAR